MMQKIKKLLFQKALVYPFVATSFVVGILFFYIPYVTDKANLASSVQNSLDMIQRIKYFRTYYTENVVQDINSNCDTILFGSDHKGINGVIPYPATTIADISEKFSQKDRVMFRIYSEYPFENRADRKLDDFQKKVIEQLQSSQKEYMHQVITKEGKEILRVAVADYLVTQSCVDCHNAHPQKMWPNDQWKLGDFRGVIEVATPLEHSQILSQSLRNKILFMIFLVVFSLAFIYYFVWRKKEQVHRKNIEDLSSTFGKYVLLSATNEEGIITQVSPKLCEVLGYTAEELIGKPARYLWHSDNSQELLEQTVTSIQNGKAWSGESKLSTKGGDPVWVYNVITPLFGSSGKVIGSHSIKQDITDAKKLESLNSELEKKIENAIAQAKKKDVQILNQSRLAQMGEMISMIAHQWRQPLSAITSLASGLDMKIQLGKYNPQEFSLKLEDLSSYAEHLSATIDDFREFYKTDKLKSHVFISKVIQDALNIVTISLENKNITVQTEFTCDEELYTLANELKQVLLNLIKNAEDVLIEKQIENPCITIRSEKVAKNVIISVEDNGGGIDESIQEKLFDPYFSTKTQKTGTGLGLYMSKIIVQEHCKGRLEVENTDVGAKFKIVFEVEK